MRNTIRETIFAWGRKVVLAAAGVLFLTPLCHAYTVEISTNSVLENEFLAATTTQFITTISTNPFFPQTFQMNLLGLNPNYVAPGQFVPSAPCQLDQDLASLVAVGTNTYVYGFGNGMDTERFADVQLLYGLQGIDFSSGTCAGIAISSFPYVVQTGGPNVFMSSSSTRSIVSSRVIVSTTTVINSSMTVISSTITITNTTTITNTYNWQPSSSTMWLTPPTITEGSCLHVYNVAASTINMRWFGVFPSTGSVPGGP